MSADTDVAAAVLARWQAIPSIAGQVPGGLHADRLVSPQASPYARLEVTQGPRAQEPCGLAGKGLPYFDYRHVVVKLFGVGKQVIGDLLAAIKGTLDEQPLTIQNGIWLRTEMLPDNVEPDDKTKAGADVYDGIAEWCVWSQRNY